MAPDFSQIASSLRTHQQLVRAGMSNNLISSQRRRGDIVRLTHGIYLVGDVVKECTQPADRALAVTAALAKVRPTAVVSHQSAALVWGAPLFELPAKVHLSLPRAHKAGHPQAVLHSPRPELCDRAVELAGLKVTSPLDTVVDCGKNMPLHESLAIADYLLRQGQLDGVQTRARLSQAQGKGCRKLRVIAEVMSPLSESPLESFACLRLYEGGLEMPVQQYGIETPSGRWYRADFAWPHLKVILEVDGLHKYYGAYRPTDAQLRNDAIRQRELELAGWTVVRATWGDLAQRPELLMGRLRSLGLGNR